MSITKLLVIFCLGIDQNPNIYTVSSSEESSDVEWVGPVTFPPVENVSDTAENLSTNRSDDANPSTSTTIDPNVPSTSGLSSSQNKTPSNVRSTMYSSDSDEEEIRTYLRNISSVTINELLREQEQAPNQIDTSNRDDDECIIDPVMYDSSGGEIDVDEPPTSGNLLDNGHNIKTEIDPEQQQLLPQEHEPQQQQPEEAKTSDSDECFFVCAKKPPHLRTPEYVELNSESDSDVVFVSCQPPMPTLDLLQSNDESDGGEAATASAAAAEASTATPKPSTSAKYTPATKSKSKRKRSTSKAHSKRRNTNDAIFKEQWTICSKTVQTSHVGRSSGKCLLCNWYFEVLSLMC